MTADAAHTARGVLLMIAAMLLIPAVDGLAKYLSAGYSPLFLGWARYAAASLVILPFAFFRHGSRIFPSGRIGVHVLRTVFLVMAMTLYFLAIARIPLATAATTSLIGPIVAVVLSVFVLKERLTLRKIVSLALGVAGSLVILGWNGSVDPGVLFALASGITFAFYLVTTRHASRDSDPLQTLAFQCVLGTLLLAPQAAFAWSVPAARDLVFFAALGIISAASHILSITAFRFADASTLAPLVYVELVGVAIIGYFAFDEVPGFSTLAGAALIVAAGLILLQRPAPAPVPGSL